VSTTLNEDKEEKDWNFRATDQRLIVLKTKNANIHMAAAQDVLSNLSFALDIPATLPIEAMQTGKEYMAHFKVYTSKNLEGIDDDFFNFFNELDIDQSMEDFIKAYWIYPTKIRFELVEVEEPET
jgi:hypothetical protein